MELVSPMTGNTHCIVADGMVVGIMVDNPGYGYSEETTVKVGSPYKFNSLNVLATEVEIKMHLNLGEKYQLECTEDHITWEKVGEPFIAEDEEVKIRLEVIDRLPDAAGQRQLHPRCR